MKLNTEIKCDVDGSTRPLERDANSEATPLAPPAVEEEFCRGLPPRPQHEAAIELARLRLAELNTESG